MPRFVPPGLGWQPALSDPRDYTWANPDVQALLGDVKFRGATCGTRSDLGEFFPEIDDQGSLNSACAFAVLGLVEYFESRCNDTPLEASRLFLYQVGLRLRGTRDDVGLDLRTTFKALIRFGAPPQQYWPYDPSRFHRWPRDPFLFGFAGDYRQLCYFRLECADESSAVQLERYKSWLAAGFPFVIGFGVPSTLSSDGLVYNGCRSKVLRGGQAVIVSGFDDSVRIGSEKGAFQFRNSWGRQWGSGGYGWIPYEYLQNRITESWGVMSPRWLSAAKAW